MFVILFLRVFTFVFTLQAASSCENVPAQYQNFANPQADGGVSLFPQPYVVYTTAPPYGVQIQQQFDGRLVSLHKLKQKCILYCKPL